MNHQSYDDVMPDRAADRVAPIFRLLGEGRLAGTALDTVVAVLQAEEQPTAAPAQLARAHQIAYIGPVEQDSAPVSGAGAFRRLVAALMLDLRPWAMPAGVRAIAVGGCRLLFAVDQYEVLVQGSPVRAASPRLLGTPRRGGHDLVGQILRDGDPVSSATVLLSGASQRSETEADDDGSFRFRGVSVGSYELDVWTGNDLIVCAPVDLQEQAGYAARW